MPARTIIINGHRLNNSEIEILANAFTSCKMRVSSGESGRAPGARAMVEAIEKLEKIALYPENMGEQTGSNAIGAVNGFNALGKPVMTSRKQAGYDLCVGMGLDDKAAACELVEGVSRLIERDKPFEAQALSLKHLDLTGHYRLMAVLMAS